MSWEGVMEERRKAADVNDCREIMEVPTGTEYQIRRLMEKYPESLWRYSEGTTLPGYVINIAKRLETEFEGAENIPTDLYPCEYFRITETSMPTEMVIQPKRLDKAKERLLEKLQRYYESLEEAKSFSDDQLIPKVACAVRIGDVWHRGKVENIPDRSVWLYVYLVDVGMTRQVTKNDLRQLPLEFGHYPPMVVRAAIRGALIHRLDIGRIDRFRELIKSIDYIARCQITSTSEPYKINLCHPIHETQNLCSFLFPPRRGEPSQQGVWLPRTIARDLKRENDVERGEHDDSGADSDFLEDDDDDDGGWDFEEDAEEHLRSLPSAKKIIYLPEDCLQIERIENERLIFLTTPEMRNKRQAIEEILKSEEKYMHTLPENWHVFGASCAVRHDDVLKRAVIFGIDGNVAHLLLVDYGITIKSEISEVLTLLNSDDVAVEPQVTLISLSVFPNIHFSRVEILRQLLPRGAPVFFERDRKSKDIPTKGELYLADRSSVEAIVIDRLSDRNLNCSVVLPIYKSSESLNELLSHRININFVYYCKSLVIYKKSKLVTSNY